MKFKIRAFALTCGLLWAGGIFVLTWWLILMHGISDEPTLLGSFYLGYSVSPAGSFIGAIWGFIDAVLGGAIFAWLYNKLSDRIN